ncbi:MSHA biogenesis protein MshP [Ideonella sp. YS5]|uniref:MSHA biogenesis protein MshP n=1 Tax=Ideonella sp. YS5 TaxID=3453714 RepID=UPI003EEE1290
MNSRLGSQRGFGAIAIVLMLVLLAAIAAAVVRLANAQQIGSAQEQNAARAAQAARAGIEWGLYQAFKGSWTSCAGASQTLDLSADLGMRATVSCSSSLYNEGESAPGTPQTVRVYTVEAVACNGSGSCPDASRVSSPTYVERRLQIQASD